LSIRNNHVLWAAGVLGVLAGACGTGYYLTHAQDRTGAAELRPAVHGAGETRVEVVKPHKGGLGRVSSQPATLQAFETVDLYSKVAGFIDRQNVDIGSRVKKGEEIIHIAVPEYEQEVIRDAAELERSRAAVKQMDARVLSAEAEARAAESAVPQAEATLAAATSTRSYREKKYNRLKKLAETEKAIELKIIDEERDNYDASISSENAAREGVIAARARLDAARARIASSRADLEEAKAKVGVTQAELDKAKVLVGYTHIFAPFDGVVTKRNYFPGDFVTAVTSGAHTELLSVDRTDKLRAVVQIPDRDVPYTRPGEEAVVEIDALRGRTFKGVIARMADTEDPQTRTMRVEIDLTNPDDALRAGMYGRATVILRTGAANAFTLPTAALIGRTPDGKATVVVAAECKACPVKVSVGADNGTDCEILDGVGPDDEVILNPSPSLKHGDPVAATLTVGQAGH
jgi:RND family efflux transporter MFP subunit